ncbi:hypothetical protein [Protofrankia symbiont of Coriaria ruscifolia]|uniref:hypothetical protein n=1 Tax=Protofrankia symbiont of Coriaria ruscifolia TaxID=1306542 RepID=UPI001F5EFADB|nr:hypothetical protein [Protofrankia symbiont of Coriaria ruscifolia]
MAGAHLGRLLNEQPAMLLVIDDVWEAEQLEPFLIGGHRCARLVTTRMPAVLPGGAVRVDQMSPEQARRVLTWELDPPLVEPVAAGLLAATGRWPLLLRLVNRLLAGAVGTGQEVSEAGREVLQRLHTAGPGAVDDLNEVPAGLNLNDSVQRARAVRTTIEAGTSLLPGQGAQRLAELGIFAEDEAVPVGLLLLLWQATAGVDPTRGRQLCRQMDQLSLVSLDADRGVVFLHDVVRDYLRAQLGPDRLATLNGTLLDAVAAGLPGAGPLTEGAPNPRVAWWDLDETQPYLWDHLVQHLLEAGRVEQADAVAGDLRWVGARLQRFGPTAPYADLSQVPTSRAATLRGGLSRAAHLLTPTTPARCVMDVLHSRLHEEPGWETQAIAAQVAMPRPRLVNHWPLPDRPDPAVRRILTGHTDRVNAVAVAPDGTWIASAGNDRSVRIWHAPRQSCEAMMRVDGALSDCAWIANTRLLALVGSAGTYLFNLLRDAA